MEVSFRHRSWLLITLLWISEPPSSKVFPLLSKTHRAHVKMTREVLHWNHEDYDKLSPLVTLCDSHRLAFESEATLTRGQRTRHLP